MGCPAYFVVAQLGRLINIVKSSTGIDNCIFRCSRSSDRDRFVIRDHLVSPRFFIEICGWSDTGRYQNIEFTEESAKDLA